MQYLTFIASVHNKKWALSLMSTLQSASEKHTLTHADEPLCTALGWLWQRPWGTIIGWIVYVILWWRCVMAAMIVVVTVVGKNTGLCPHWAAMMKWSTNWVSEIFTYSITVPYDSTVQKGCTYVLSKGLISLIISIVPNTVVVHTEKTYCNGDSV